MPNQTSEKSNVPGFLCIVAYARVGTANLYSITTPEECSTQMVCVEVRLVHPLEEQWCFIHAETGDVYVSQEDQVPPRFGCEFISSVKEQHLRGQQSCGSEIFMWGKWNIGTNSYFWPIK